MFKWLQSRVLWGIILILGGVVFLLQNFGFYEFGDIFWALVFGVAGIFFLSFFAADRTAWWALIPGFFLLSLGVLIGSERLLPSLNDSVGGAIVLGGLAVGFLAVYLVDRKNWWAIIPGGVMLTLTLIVALEAFQSGLETGGLLFLGIAFTFALVAVVPNPSGEMTWAWIPAGIMGVMGFLILAATESFFGYLWPLALILVGLFMILRTFRFRARS
jgi:hypothetical protein